MMSQSDLAKGCAVVLCVVVAGYLSMIYVDERFATAPTSSSAPSACIGEGGSWKNWPWPNVPMGSPKCR